jgi:PST family polysaccharide transporter
MLSTEPGAAIATPAAQRDDLAGKFATGVAWSGLAKAVSQSVGWMATLLVARYLSPSDYGLFGLAMLYLGLLQLVSDFGIGTAILANRHSSDEDLPEIHGLAALTGLAGTLFVIVTSPLVGRFFSAPQLPLLLVALSPTFLINSLRTVPQALLQRDFHFRWLAILDAGQSLVLSILSVLLAKAGFGYWTLAIAAIVSAFLNTTLVVSRLRVRLTRPVVRRLRPLIGFSTQVVLQRIAWYLASNADFATAGKLLGKAAAGVYMLAWSFANAPIERVASLILQVSPSVLGAAASDRPALKAHVIRATQMIALAVFPMCIGMALVARPFVMVLLGEKWEGAIVPLQLLATYAAVRALVPLLGQVLLVVEEERFATRLMFLNLIVLLTAFVIGAKVSGVVGIAAAYMIAHPFIAFAYARRALHRIGCGVREFFVKAVWPAAACTIVMSLVVWGADAGTKMATPSVSLACQITAGAVAYTITAVLLYRTQITSLLRVARARRL